MALRTPFPFRFSVVYMLGGCCLVSLVLVVLFVRSRPCMAKNVGFCTMGSKAMR